MRLFKYVLKDALMSIQGSERDRLEWFARSHVGRGLFFSMDRYICILMPYDMPAISWLRQKLGLTWSVLGDSRCGLHREVMDSSELGGDEALGALPESQPCQDPWV